MTMQSCLFGGSDHHRNSGVRRLFMSLSATSLVLVPARYAFMLLRITSDTCGYCAVTGRDFAPSTTGSASANQGFALSTSGSLNTLGNTGMCDASIACIFDTSGDDNQRTSLTASTLFFENADTASCHPPMHVALLPP